MFWKRVPMATNVVVVVVVVAVALVLDFHSLRLWRFSTDRNETFHTY